MLNDMVGPKKVIVFVVVDAFYGDVCAVFSSIGKAIEYVGDSRELEIHEWTVDEEAEP